MNPESVPSLLYRLGETERRLGLVEADATKVPVLANKVENLTESVHELSQEVAALRKTLITLLVGVTSSAILIVATVYTVFGG